MGVAVADFDNDDFPDLYLAGYPRNYLFRNSGSGRFRDVTAEADVAAGGWSTSAVFFDYNGDGWLDLYVGRYVSYEPAREPFCGIRKDGWRSYCLPDVFGGISGVLYRNRRGRSFVDATREARVAVPEAKTLGLAVSDYNRDGFPDLFVANDRVRNFLFRNRGDGTFEDRAELDGVAYSDDGAARAGMGCDFADFDNDGNADVLVTNFETEGAGLFRNDGRGSFTDVANRSSLGRRSYLFVGFGAKLVDLDADGRRDAFVVNGHVIDNIALYKDSVAYRQPKLVFHNTGVGFDSIALPEDVSAPSVARAAAFGDFDNDGRIDVLIANNGGPAELLANVSSPDNHWLILKLVGTRSNRDGIGARVELRAGPLRQTHEATAGSSYLSANDPRVFCGLGPRRRAERIDIHWPSGTIQTLENVSANQVLRVVEPHEVKQP